MTDLKPETRDNIYNSPEFNKFLSHAFNTSGETISQEFDAYKTSKGKKVQIKLRNCPNRGALGTSLVEGTMTVLDESKEQYDFYCIYASPENQQAMEHISNRIRYQQEADNWGIPFVPLTITSMLPVPYILSENAGKSLEEFLENKNPNDPNALAIVANQLFGVSEETLRKKFDNLSSTIKFIDQNKLIRPNINPITEESDNPYLFTELFYKGISRALTETIERYKYSQNLIANLRNYVGGKFTKAILDENQDIITKLKPLAKDIFDTTKTQEEAINAKLEDLLKIKAEVDTNKPPPDTKVIFFPIDLFEKGVTEHIRFRKENGGYEVLVIDSFLYPNQSSAGTPLEAYHRLINVAQNLRKDSNKKKNDVGEYIKNLAELIKEEFLTENSELGKIWQPYNKQIESIMTIWPDSVERYDIIKKICEKYKKEIDTIMAPFNNKKPVKQMTLREQDLQQQPQNNNSSVQSPSEQIATNPSSTEKPANG
jgi:hypothetical protein